MPFQSAPNCASAVINATYGGKNIANVLHFKKADGYDSADLLALAELVDAAVGGTYLDWVDDECEYINTVVTGLTDEVDLQRVANTNAGPGLLDGNGLPGNVSFVVTLRSAFTGRSARGRFYAFPFTNNVLFGIDGVTSAYGDGIVAFLEEVQVNALAAGWLMIVLSRFSGGVKRAEAVPFTVTDIAYRNLQTDSQRGRLPDGH